MIVTYKQYTALGYTVCPESQYPRYEAMARLEVSKYTFDRVTANNASEDNQRGICELVDMYYLENNPVLDNQQVSSFSNNGYSETFTTAKTTDNRTLSQKTYAIIQTYFTPDQLYRGVDYQYRGVDCV